MEAWSPAGRQGRPSAETRTERAGLIASRENRWLKLFRATLAGRGLAHKDKQELIGLEGPHLVEEALRSGMEVEAILASPAGENHLKKLLRHLGPGMACASLPLILRTTEKLFASISATESPQGIAALSKPRSWSFDDLLRGDVPLVVMLAGVQDPGNVGTILRSAEAFRATGAVATRGSAHPWMPKVLRASAGSAMRLPILSEVTAPVVLAQLRLSGIKIFAASTRSVPDRPRSAPDEIDLRGPVALIVGNEGGGLPPEIERSADGLILIPVASGVDSLNAAVAASVLLYEAARQRREGT
jgi:RNA methyltransferase, TrmH family